MFTCLLLKSCQYRYDGNKHGVSKMPNIKKINIRHQRYPSMYSNKLCKTPPLWMHLNMLDGKCWCGCPRESWGSRMKTSCRTDHTLLRNQICIWWSALRESVLSDRVNTSKTKPCFCGKYDDGNTWCPMCGTWTVVIKTYTCVKCSIETVKPEVDHILAKCLGGEPCEEDNLQILCRKCHVIKTASDISKARNLEKSKK